jgi:hypothetical protein
MLRTVFASAGLLLALTLLAGCGGQATQSGPKLANPDDARVKNLKVQTPSGGPGNKFSPQ